MGRGAGDEGQTDRGRRVKAGVSEGKRKVMEGHRRKVWGE